MTLFAENAKDNKCICESFIEKNKRVVELEKENAELKSMSNLDRCFQLERSKQQLTKAKEILQLFLKLKTTPCASGNSINMLQFENTCKQAEQFLKEVEK